MPEETDQVRMAARRLTSAVDAHLRAVEKRSGEQDPFVQQAYRALREASAAYDDVLFDVHGEVTPFALAEPAPHETFEVAPHAGHQPQRLSLLSRTDVAVEDSARLIERVQAEAGAIDAGAIDAGEAVVDEVSAVGMLVEMAGVDALVGVGSEYGLQALGSTAWLLAAQPQPGDAWMDDAFAHADPNKVIFRLDALM